MADEKKVTIVTAAGNQNIIAEMDPMKRSDKIITVSALNDKDEKAFFSNYRYSLSENGSALSAPGTFIYSCFPGSKYQVLDGTSMASPIVAGAIGLVKTLKPNITNKQLFKLLRDTAEESGYKDLSPRLNIKDLLVNCIN